MIYNFALIWPTLYNKEFGKGCYLHAIILELPTNLKASPQEYEYKWDSSEFVTIST